MKSIKFFTVLVLFALSAWLTPATYKEKSIDGAHFQGKLWQKDPKEAIPVNVVFAGKAANLSLIYNINKIVPPLFEGGERATLYLKNEKIANPAEIPLRQIIPPILSGDEKLDPDKCQTLAAWTLSADLEKVPEKE